MSPASRKQSVICNAGTLRSADLERTAALLRNGGVVVYPTETVYGIGCDAMNAAAVERIFRLKERDGAKPLSVIVPDIAGAERLAVGITPGARRLMKACWPGPLTIIFTAAPGVPAVLHAGTGTVGMRISSGGVAAELCRTAGVPLVATSANRSGEPAALAVTDLPDDVRTTVDCIIDGGPCASPVVSTIVDMSGGVPRILRSGAVPDTVVFAAVGDV